MANKWIGSGGDLCRYFVLRIGSLILDHFKGVFLLHGLYTVKYLTSKEIET
jgi:hypothetical protein